MTGVTSEHCWHSTCLKSSESTVQVCEQTLKALGMEVCGDLIAHRGLIGALFSPVATDSFLSAGLGLGRTVHGEPPREGEVSRKGISCERTFAAISSIADLEAKVIFPSPHPLSPPAPSHGPTFHFPLIDVANRWPVVMTDVCARALWLFKSWLQRQHKRLTYCCCSMLCLLGPATVHGGRGLLGFW